MIAAVRPATAPCESTKSSRAPAFPVIGWNFTTPPLCVTEAELREVFGIIDAGLAITDRAVS